MLTRRAIIGAMAVPLLPACLVNANHDPTLVHLLGDSIMRGYGLGRWAEEVPETDPLYPLRSVASVASVANLVLEENGRAVRFVYHPVRLHEPWDAIELYRRFSTGVIRPGHTVVLEDAGDHPGNPAVYEDRWLRLRRVIVGHPGVAVVMMTMFDYASDPSHQYDTVIQPHGRTMNDATRAAALANVRGDSGRTRLIDMNAIMDSWRRHLIARFGLDPINDDGIHPTAWGQIVMASALIHALGIRLVSAGRLADAAGANWRYMRYFSRLSRAQVRHLAEEIMISP